MKYQTEYQRNYQKRIPRKSHQLSAEERKLNEVPIKRSTTRRRGRSVPNQNNSDDNFAVIGPNDKFSDSRLYRLKEPVKDYPRVRKSAEYALLGRNEKFENNVAYPLRQPVISNSPRVVVRRRKHENHSCGIQTELGRTKNNSRYKRETDPNRKRFNPQSEYKQQFINWKKSSSDDQIYIDESKYRERRSDPQISKSVAVNTPARVEIDVNKTKQPVTRSAKVFQPKRDETTEYRARYTPLINPKPRKAFEAEQIDERKRIEIDRPERAYSDDEDINRNIDLGNEFRHKSSYGKLRRWKSEYQSKYKPFWRFDYKNGKWYKDDAADETGFNPNLFWHKELMSTRKRADQYRANAEEDHFNPKHSLQLQTGFSLNNNYRAWDTDDDDSVISIDRDLERERIEGERRREKDAKRVYPKKEKASTKKTNQVSQTEHQVPQSEHQVDRVIYVDEPPPKEPSVATKAFVRNLGSSSVQQHMSWDSDSVNTQRTNSDLDSHRKYQNYIIRPTSSKKIGTHSPISTERQQNYISPKIKEQINQETNTNAIRPTKSYQETTRATGRPSYDAHTFDKRPYRNVDQYCTYPGSRFKDEVTEYYYGNDDNRHTPISKPSFDNHVPTLDERYGRTYDIRNKDDDVISVNSVQSLSSSCSLASQTLDRAQKNMNKYWGDNSTSSPKKPNFAKH